MSDNQPPICDYEGSDYQASFWDTGGRAYEDAVEEIALRRLLPARGQLLLELGAGAGRNTPRYHGFERVVLLDYALSQLQLARHRLGDSPRYVYVAADIYHLPFVTGLFDAATMIRTLHHMVDAPRALRQVSRVLQNQAIFILEYASKQNLKAILRYILRRQTWNPFSPEPVEFAALNFDFSPRWVRRCLQEADLQIERQLTVSHFRIDLLKRLLPVSWLVRLDALAQYTGNYWQLTPSVFVRTHAGNSQHSSVQTLPTDPGAFFSCPGCGQAPLAATPTGADHPALLCRSCGQAWPVRDGIYDFRLAD